MSFTDEEIESEIRLFLAQSAPNRKDEVAALDRHAKIWDALDSLSLLDLVEYVEQRFQVTVTPLELLPQNFTTIDDIVRFIRAHAQAKPPER